MAAKGCDGLLMRAQPLGAAEEISRRIVDVQVMGDTLLLDADPAWAGANNTFLVKKGLRVNELRAVSDMSLPEDKSRGSVPPSLLDMPAR